MGKLGKTQEGKRKGLTRRGRGDKVFLLATEAAARPTLGAGRGEHAVRKVCFDEKNTDLTSCLESLI
jgi:hypothetical protein